jgi:hypothetical protein
MQVAVEEKHGLLNGGWIMCKRDFLRTVTPALLTDGLRIEGGI